jgi:hypothetical protein
MKGEPRLLVGVSEEDLKNLRKLLDAVPVSGYMRVGDLIDLIDEDLEIRQNSSPNQ